MGCVFSFDVRWGSSQSIFWAAEHLLCFFILNGCFFSGPDLIHSYRTHLPIFISILPTLVSYYLSPNNIGTLFTYLPYKQNHPIDISTLQT
jgi:hypothetical protein